MITINMLTTTIITVTSMNTKTLTMATAILTSSIPRPTMRISMDDWPLHGKWEALITLMFLNAAALTCLPLPMRSHRHLRMLLA
ncbi:MAG TPA: hypothetical protein VEK08_25540 [Planctomycetota bacterium]|nr:hypothetical protein [Planctomycetota bacterium]